MKTTISQLLKIKADDQLTVKSINFLVHGETEIVLGTPVGDISFVSHDSTLLDNILKLKKSETKKVEKPIKKTTKKPTTTKQAVPKPKIVKKSRRIRCPLTDNLIPAEEYHANKKAGKYKFDSEGMITVVDKSKG